MLNVNAITSTLAKLPDQALQKYAALHKEDPYIMALAVAESNRRKELRNAAQAPQGMPEPPKVADQALAAMAPQAQPLPEDTGIGQLPAGDMNFADGGIIAFAKGDKVEAASGAKMFAAALDAEGVRDPRERAFLMALHGQEASGQKTAPTSNRGAMGAMQVMPETFKSVADKGMRIDNPMDNMRAGIRYGLQGYRAANGDPVLAGAYYYGGPNALKKARRGIALSDPENPNYPNTLTYGQKIAKRMTSLIPIAAANAADTLPPATAPTISAPSPAAGLPTLTRDQMLAQIPGTSRPPAPAPVAPSALETLAAETYPSSGGAAFVPPKSGVRKKPASAPAPAPVAASALEALAAETYPSSEGAAFVPPKSGVRKKPAPAPAPAPAAGLPALTREQMIAQIPGQDGRPVTAQPSRAEPPRTLADYITSPFQTVYSMAHNTAALPIAGADVVARRLAGEKDPSLELDKFFYIPKNPVAQQQLGIIGGAMTDLKIPPYLPAMGGVRGPRPPAAQAAQDMAKVEAPRLPPPAPPTPAAAKVAAPRLTPPAPPSRVAGASPESEGILRIHPDRAAALEERRLAMLRADKIDAADEAADVAEAARRRVDNLAADKAQAARAAQHVNERNANIANARAVNEALPGQGERLGLAGLAGVGTNAGRGEPTAAAAPVVTQSNVPGPGEAGWGSDLGQQDVPDKKDIIQAAKETGAKPPKGTTWTSDDWLTLGLNLMATKSPRFLQAVGDAGLATLKSRQERRKTERDLENEGIVNAYRQANTKKLEAETAALTGPTANTKLALSAADTMYDNWLNRIKANPVEGMNLTQADADAQYQAFLKRAFAAYKIPVPAELSGASAGVGNFKVLGSRPAP